MDAVNAKAWVSLIVALVFAFAWPAAGAAEDPPFVGWTALLPALSMPYDAASPDDCVAGRAGCVDKTIREMTKRFDPLASSCDHDAIFSLVYLRVTEEYRRTIETPFFDDTPFVNYEDGIFAHYYFAAYDAWAAGRTADVPPAWRAAFDAARDRRVSALGDLLLGINARPAGSPVRALQHRPRRPRWIEPQTRSRPRRRDPQPRHRRRHRRDRSPLRSDDRRHEPANDARRVRSSNLVAWREAAWRNAELLAAAPSAAARDLVASEIESNAASEAAAIRLSTRICRSRAAEQPVPYCAAHRRP
jgi:hypothetical protein